jgi:hypothetical protein
MTKKIQTIISFTALVLVLGSGFWYFKFQNENSMVVADKAMSYLNNSLLSYGLEASLINATDKGNLVKINFEVEDQQYTSYATKDGELFFLEAVNLDEELKALEEKESDDRGGTQQEVEISKTDKPDVKLFVMSYCPYGLQAQKAYLPVYELLKEEADMGIYFVDYAMHGQEEIDENLRQYCIQKEQSDKFIDYLACFVENGEAGTCLTEALINQSQMDTCIAAANEEFDTENPNFSIDSALNDEYGIQGSPSLVINNTYVPSFERSAEGLKDLVCSAFNEQPEDCSENLSEVVYSSGFGLDESSTSANSSCE